PEAHGHAQLLLPRDDDLRAAAPQRRRPGQARLPRPAHPVTVAMALPLHDLPLFMAAGLLLNLTPGPDMLFVAGSSAAHGRRSASARAACSTWCWPPSACRR